MPYFLISFSESKHIYAKVDVNHKSKLREDVLPKKTNLRRQVSISTPNINRASEITIADFVEQPAVLDKKYNRYMEQSPAHCVHFGLPQVDRNFIW